MRVDTVFWVRSNFQNCSISYLGCNLFSDRERERVCVCVCVCVCAMQFNIIFNVISVVSCRCLFVADIVLLHQNAILQVFWCSIPPDHILQSTTGKLTIFPWSHLLMLSAYQESTKYHFLSLVWHSRELNPWPPAHRLSDPPLDHWVRSQEQETHIWSFFNVCH